MSSFVALSTNADGCQCSDSQKLDAINHNIAEGFRTLFTEGSLGTNTFIDGSGTIASAGVSQEIFQAKADRNYLFILNPSDTVMYIDFAVNAVASQPSIPLVANGGFYEPLVAPNQTVNIICAAAGREFIAKQA